MAKTTMPAASEALVHQQIQALKRTLGNPVTVRMDLIELALGVKEAHSLALAECTLSEKPGRTNNLVEYEKSKNEVSSAAMGTYDRVVLLEALIDWQEGIRNPPKPVRSTPSTPTTVKDTNSGLN